MQLEPFWGPYSRRNKVQAQIREEVLNLVDVKIQSFCSGITKRYRLRAAQCPHSCSFRMPMHLTCLSWCYTRCQRTVKLDWVRYMLQFKISIWITTQFDSEKKTLSSVDSVNSKDVVQWWRPGMKNIADKYIYCTYSEVKGQKFVCAEGGLFNMVSGMN